jgi:molybdopterin synthase catalytic subunit
LVDGARVHTIDCDFYLRKPTYPPFVPGSTNLRYNAPVRIQVLYFAVLRERFGRDGEPIDLPPGSRVADLLAWIREQQPAFPSLERRVQVAVNRQMVAADHVLAEGDEVALIPPVSGGSGHAPPAPGVAPRRIALAVTALSLDELVRSVEGPGQGAIATFTGNVRSHGTLADVQRLEYEAYEPMALEVMAAIAGEIEGEIPGVQLAIHHRLGTLSVGEAAVIIAASAPHRAEAFAACRAAIERLKQRAPIWKKEVGADGQVWVGTGP